MRKTMLMRALAPALLCGAALAGHVEASAQTVLPRPSEDVTISVGAGKLVRLPSAMADFFIADPAIGDVQIQSPTQLYIFGKAAGETTVYATNSSGRVIYSANVRVGTNIDSVGAMLRKAMPEADIEVTTMNGAVLLTGTVASPADVEDASRLSQAYLGESVQVISRLKTATPMQVMLKVTIAEVSRSLTKNIGVNLQATALGDGSLGFLSRGRDFIGDDGRILTSPERTTIGWIGEILGVDVAAAADLQENSALVSVLAEPSLTALSGETASFLAGGEFPIPVAEGINGTSIEFKTYGVSLAFTPTVLDGGRIAMRVRPEVSELTSEGSIVLSNVEIPGLSTRRAETTVELGSGQSFVLAGLLRNNGNNSVERTPFLGNLPILGALFRSSGFRRNQTELLIVVTPYLVKPVDANRIALPTDGFRIANDGQRVLLGQEHDSRSGERRPVPTAAPPQTVLPGFDTSAAAPAAPTLPASTTAAPRPGFGF